MKPFFLFFLTLCIIALTACGVNEALPWECVSDDLVPPPRPAFSLKADLPEDFLLQQESGEGRLTLYEDYEIHEEVFPADSAAEALERLTGRTAPAAVCLSDFPREEYRLSWTAAGEGEDTACCGKVIYDGTFCYALTIHCPARRENDHREAFYALLSGSELVRI